MKKIGVFEMAWKGMSVWDRQAFNNAADSINAVQAQQSAAGHKTTAQLRTLFELDEAQGEEILRLRVVVEVLSKMLLDAGVIDETVFGHRLEAAIEEVDYEKNEAIAAEQAKREQAELIESKRRQIAATGVEGTSTCASCGQRVATRETQLTGEGSVCDRCFHAVGS